LYIRDQVCSFCETGLYVCSHRKRRVFTLQGPCLLIARLGHCPDPGCQGYRGTVSPREEMAIAPPRLAVGWDVFAWIGHRRFARHWSVPQICAELSDSHAIDLSEDAVEDYVRQYAVMVTARHTDREQMRKAYAQTKSLVLAIDGLQPEKGHETLYVVRELNQKRVWFAEPLLSSTNDEVRRVWARTRQIAEALGIPVVGWMSDKQEAFVQGIAAEFPGVPHRFCDNHFLAIWQNRCWKDSARKSRCGGRCAGCEPSSRPCCGKRQKTRFPQRKTGFPAIRVKRKSRSNRRWHRRRRPPRTAKRRRRLCPPRRRRGTRMLPAWGPRTPQNRWRRNHLRRGNWSWTTVPSCVGS
jgi:hypothetical protein